MRDTRHSQNGIRLTARSKKLHGYLLASAVVFAGCGSMTAPIDDSESTPEPTLRAFGIALSVTELDESVCEIEVIAETRGGAYGAYAEWKDLQARAFDPNTGEYVGNARTQQIYPEVFDAGRLYAGGAQRGALNLEHFRRDEGQQVMVELEFYYTAWENGEYQDRMARVNHDCL